MINTKYLKIAFLALFLLVEQVSAQNIATTISGVVRDEFQRPLIGAVVTSSNNEHITSTNLEGKYTIAISDDSDALVFSYLGYLSKTVEIGLSEEMDVVLVPDSYNPDETIYLGHTSQRKEDITGSVATVRGSELMKSPTASLGLSLVGRLPGLYTRESYSEPSRESVQLWIRGANTMRDNPPLVIIDGFLCPYNPNETLSYISAAEIESVSILKDAASQAIYGIQGANGVIVITTKKGTPGETKINVRVDAALQEMTTKPMMYNSADYTSMRNQAAENDGRGANFYFSDDAINKFRSGENQELYPNTDWYGMFLKKHALMQRVGTDISGGNDRVRYFSNLNVMHQGGQFKTDQPKYDADPDFFWANFRSNIDVKLTQYISAFLNLSGNIKREKASGPGWFSDSLYGSIFNMNPTIYGPTTPTVTDPETGEIQGGQVVATETEDDPTYGRLNRSGYTNHTVTNIYSQFGLKLDLSFIAKGLSASGVIGYQTNNVNSTITSQDYERWMRSSDENELTFIKKGSETNTALDYSKNSTLYYHLTYKGILNYEKNFGDKHRVTGMGYMFYQNLVKANTDSPLSLPYDRVSMGLEATYAYDNRYLLKASVGHSGSEQYARSSRYLTTPAFSAGWVVSNESFMKDVEWLSNLKLRASVGMTGDDQSGLNRFVYLDNVTLTGGGPIGYFQYNINEKTIANPNIMAEKIKKQNYGIDLGLFKGLDISFDLFKERIDNMVVSATGRIPQYQGVSLSQYPATNTGTAENKGYEVSVNYTKAIDKDLTINIGGFFSDAENKMIDTQEGLKDDSYVYRTNVDGFPLNQQFGYLVDKSNGNGFFNSEEEVANSKLTYTMGSPRVGDLIYQDLNEDGIIDEKDKAPIGHGSIPRNYYGISGGLTYKSLDFSFLLQGVGKWGSIYSGKGVYETSYSGVFGSIHQNAWTEERFKNGEEISYPALSTVKSVNHESSDFFYYDRSYLRLKNIEIGYTLPQKWAKAITASKIRVALSGQNLITWDKMKSSDFGPEASSYDAIPVYRTYNLGVSLQF